MRLAFNKIRFYEAVKKVTFDSHQLVMLVLIIICDFKSNALADTSYGQYPYLATQSCGYQVNLPEKVKGYYLSQDCNTVFLLPHAMGSIHVGKPQVIGTLKENCNSLLLNQSNMNKLVEAQNKLTLRLADEGLSEQEKENIIKRINFLDEQINKSLSRFNKVPGLQFQMDFSNTLTSDDFLEFRRINFHLPLIQVRAADISNGVGSFTMHNNTQERVSSAISTVIEAEIPGLDGISDVKSYTDKNVLTVAMNGALSARVLLSLYASCPFLNKNEQGYTDELNISRESLTSNLVGNYSYKVPVLSSFGFEGRITTEILPLLFRKLKESLILTSSDVAELLSKPEFSDGVYFNAWTMKGNAIENISDISELSKLKEESMKRLSERFVKFLENMQEVVPTPVSQSIFSSYQKQCYYRNMSFFRGTYESRCEIIGYRWNSKNEHIPNALLEALKEGKISLTERVEANSIVERVHTSGFRFQKLTE